MKYRREIDGLRAIAVIPVILFHADIHGFAGGYVGVDIFFVISGYLITSIILNELKNSSFSLLHFYERRARRILPALTFMLLWVSAMAYVFLPADPLQSYSLSLANVATFTSNIYFYLNSGYFSPLADERLLIHTWSLAVEEQYYLLFPLLALLLWKYAPQWLLTSIIVLMLLSFGSSEFLQHREAHNANFYLIFSRAWELLMGSALAFVPRTQVNLKTPTVVREVLSLIGLLLIAYAIHQLDKNTPFPGLYALFPVVGASLVIVFCSSQSVMGALLSNRLFVFIGLISYSLYLWHQPLLALLRIKSVGTPPLILMLLAIAVSVIMAYLSWKFIETPFRDKNRFKRASIFTYSALSITLCLLIGLLGYHFKGFPNRFESIDYSDSITFSHKTTDCNTSGLNYLDPQQACHYHHDNITWAALGDSHIITPALALADHLKSRSEGVLHLSFSACPAALTLDLKAPPGCSDWFAQAVERIEQEHSIRNVLLSFRYSRHLYGVHLRSYPELPNQDPAKKLTAEFLASMQGSAEENYWRSLKSTIERLQKSGKHVYVLYPVPELPVSITKAVSPFSIFSNQTMIDLNQAVSLDYFYRRNAYMLQKLDSLTYADGLYAIKPHVLFCKDAFCPAMLDGKSLYFDDHHLSVYGAEQVIEALIDAYEHTFQH